MIYSSDLFAYNAKYFRTLSWEKCNLLPTVCAVC